jgi:hypothetical protein
VDLFLKPCRAHLKEIARHLAEGLVGRARSAEEHRNSDHAFIADGGDLNHASVRAATDD